ncbi:LPLT family lysophospholipid transporter-like MFS transporter [Paraburkholderia sp. EB58]|jgi:LPLT family lysophospholipid transporter-like MFS transporter|uniref:lysophospholipid transporter LplT n=1 Tax=Paraburkholderia sp. EB58 TaxID=3035125 RepID=UPI003D22BC9F
MKRGFYTIIAAQFFSSLADNALLIAAIALLTEQHAPPWMTPVLKLFFVLSYVGLAAFVGAFADAFPKGRVMFGTNLVKVVGCVAMLAGVPPLISYGIVGLGAAAYSPAKYGILTELLPPDRLVAANGWMEGTTVLSIVLGTVCGGILISPHMVQHIMHRAMPFTGHAPRAAILIITAIYLIAAVFNLWIPDTGVRYPPQQHGPIRLAQDFTNCFTVLWKDRIGQISLAVTTLLWGAAQTLQFIVLQWAQHSLGLSLSQASILQAFVAIGVAIGAVIAAAKIPLRRALNTLPVGLAIGGSIFLMAFFSRDLVPVTWVVSIGAYRVPAYIAIACVFLAFIGGLSGFFVVPMNAVLQHRGHVLLSAGHSIAVQNFNENLSILVTLCLYTILVWFHVSITTTIVIFSSFVVFVMLLIMRQHRENRLRDAAPHW